jgi:type IV pilus assembly protein PilF
MSTHRNTLPLALVATVSLLLSGCGSTPIFGGGGQQAANKPAVAEPPKLPEPKPDAREAARLRIELAGLYLSRGSVTPALEEATSASKLDPDNAQAFNLLGLINMQLRDDAQAVGNFERALRLSPSDPDVNNNYGWFLCERGRPMESIRLFQAALRSPLYANADRTLANAGVCSRRGGDEAGARRFFEQALVQQPAQPVALFQLADMDFAAGNARQARVLMERLMQATAPTPEVLWLGVRIERALGDRKAEMLYAQQLRRTFPSAPETALLGGATQPPR